MVGGILYWLLGSALTVVMGLVFFRSVGFILVIDGIDVFGVLSDGLFVDLIRLIFMRCL